MATGRPLNLNMRNGKKLLGFNAAKTQPVSFDCSNNSGIIDLKMNGSVLKKSNLLTCWDCFSLPNWIGSFYKVSFSEAALYLYKSTIRHGILLSYLGWCS